MVHNPDPIITKSVGLIRWDIPWDIPKKFLMMGPASIKLLTRKQSIHCQLYPAPPAVGEGAIIAQ